MACDMYATIKFLPHFFIKKRAQFTPISTRMDKYTTVKFIVKKVMFYSMIWRDLKKLKVKMFILILVDIHNFVSLVTLRVHINQV